VVEILMAMAVLAVGVVGIISTQKVTLASNLHAKNLAIATHIAQSWIGVLDAESMLWASAATSADPLGRTTWLKQVDNNTGWFRPAYDATRGFGPSFDALGNPVANAAQAQFCVDLRLSPLTTANFGGGLIRTEVRVVWLRPEVILGGTAVAAANACSTSTAQLANVNDQLLFHFVFMSSAVRQVNR
jgi:hypothetical protein